MLWEIHYYPNALASRLLSSALYAPKRKLTTTEQSSHTSFLGGHTTVNSASHKDCCTGLRDSFCIQPNRKKKLYMTQLSFFLDQKVFLANGWIIFKCSFLLKNYRFDLHKDANREAQCQWSYQISYKQKDAYDTKICTFHWHLWTQMLDPGPVFTGHWILHIKMSHWQTRGYPFKPPLSNLRAATMRPQGKCCPLSSML